MDLRANWKLPRTLVSRDYGWGADRTASALRQAGDSRRVRLPSRPLPFSPATSPPQLGLW